MHVTTTGTPAFTVEEKGPNVHYVHFDAPSTVGWEQWVLLSSDRHWDNPHSDWTLQRKHLDEAKEKGAAIIDTGDLFCAMQGKFDKRSSKDKLRPEHRCVDYFDALTDTAADWFAPYARNFAVIGYGNHETAVLKRNEVDLTRRLVTRIKDRYGVTIHRGGYTGWVRLKVTAHGTMKRAINVHYHHGYGGGGPVTKGTIQSNRKAVYLPDADLCIGGHVHERWMLDLMRVRLSQQGRVYHDHQRHVSLPTYKEEYQAGEGGWHVERGAPPKPLGACWLRLYFDKKELRYDTVWAQ